MICERCMAARPMLPAAPACPVAGGAKGLAWGEHNQNVIRLVELLM